MTLPVIVIIGMGHGTGRHLTGDARRTLLSGQPLYLLTGRHPAARLLARKGVAFRTFDRHYRQSSGNLDQFYRLIEKELIQAARQHGRVYYGLPGPPRVCEATVKRLRASANRRRHFNHNTTALSPAQGRNFSDLVEIMDKLRSSKGCPWDREQTHQTLRPYLVEEAYEVISAIDQGSPTALREELGDLLLQVVFHSQIARERGLFNIWQVIEGIVDKLIRRHPHVFSGESASTADRVWKRWQQIKSEERGGGKAQSRLKEEAHLPALLRARKVQQQASALGFDWRDTGGALEKLKEELQELEDAYREGLPAKIEEELGDFLFATVNLSRFLKQDPEVALGRALRKFMERFCFIERQVALSGRGFTHFSLEELDQWWEMSKHKG